MLKHRILIVDDEEAVRSTIKRYLERKDFAVDEAPSLEGAEKLFRLSPPDAAVLDYQLPDGNALELLADLREIDPDVPVIILTGHGSIDLAVQAIKEGAEHFLTKPVELSALATVLDRALEHQRTRRKELAGRSGSARQEIDPFVGTSRSIRSLQEEATLALRSESPVLIQGETGSGKGVLARWLHGRGSRADEAFVDLNCAGLSRELLESELFGHAKGAFTGAVSNKKGLFEVAHRGSLFLDEIGDVDPAIQPKLLKVLEEKRFRRLGEVNERSVDVRLIAASNQDLARLVREKSFRSDLYFRINTIALRIPPLRERQEDIQELAAVLLSQLADGRHQRQLGPGAVKALQGYGWPGNIRELRNVLERAVLLAGDEAVLSQKHLRFETAVSGAPGAGEADLTLQEMEKRQIEQVLEAEKGRVAQAAERLHIPRSTLYQKIKGHGIDLARFKG